MKVAIYARVSTDEQVERQTIENQLKGCREYAEQHQFEVVEEFLDEGVSGSVPLEERPSGGRLFKDAEAKRFERVVVYRLDRLSRDTLGALLALKRLEGMKVPVESVDEKFDDSPSGEFARTVMMGVAELEKNLIRGRTMAGRQRRIRDGKYQAPTTPYGYVYDPTTGLLTENPEQGPVVRQMFAWALEGYGSKEIANRLDAAGLPAPQGNRRKIQSLGWNWSTIAKMLKAPRYMGTNTYAGTPMQCPALIDLETFELVQRGLADRKRESRRNTKQRYLLQHLIFCRHCGSAYGSLTRRSGQQWYACHQRRTYGVKAGHTNLRWHFPASVIETAVKDAVAWVTADPEQFFADIDSSVETEKHQLETMTARIRKLEETLDGFKAQEERVLAMGRRGTIDESHVDQQFATIAQERRQVEVELKAAKEEAAGDTAQQRLDFLIFIASMRGSRLPVRVRRDGKHLRPQLQIDAREGARYVFVDADSDEPEESTFEEWRTWIRQFVSRIWVEEDGRLTLEGPGQIQIGEVGMSMPSR